MTLNIASNAPVQPHLTSHHKQQSQPRLSPSLPHRRRLTFRRLVAVRVALIRPLPHEHPLVVLERALDDLVVERLQLLGDPDLGKRLLKGADEQHADLTGQHSAGGGGGQYGTCGGTEQLFLWYVSGLGTAIWFMPNRPNLYGLIYIWSWFRRNFRSMF